MKNLFVLFSIGVIALCGSTLAIDWDDLRFTYDIISFGHFTRMPRTSSNAVSQGWVPVNEQDCSGSDGRFHGHRYMYPEDNSVALIYDVNGIIAGVQTYFSHDDIITPNNTMNYEAVPMYQNVTIDEVDYFALTAYFVEPEIICTTGRTEQDLELEGTGTGLWLQNGGSPFENVEVPLNRSDAISAGWTQNNCFGAMGSHNFYKVEEMDNHYCSEMRPAFGLYSKADELLGFGFILPGTVIDDRFENPPLLAIEAILGDTPDCIRHISETIGLTSMHVYFIDNPWLINCL